ncbi:MAG: NrfD/PsrC family molybdoenzyme membrane anchor subunit [Thermodesulfobacteriota bacterium]
MIGSQVEVRPEVRGSVPVFLGVITGLICLVGLSFGLHSMLVGHEHTFGTSREVPWGILIASYVLFACLSTGLCIISSMGQIFKVQLFKPLVRRTVFLAIITMAAGLLSITLELENPWRVGIFSLFSPHPQSNIWWKSTIYSFFLFLMLFNMIYLLQGRQNIAFRFGLAALIFVTLANLNMNSDMALLGSRGFWREQYMPLFFLTLSVLSACGAVMFFTWLSHFIRGQEISGDTRLALTGIAKLAVSLLAVSLFFVMFKVLSGIGLVPTNNPEAMDLLVKGDFALNFWIGEVGLAVVLPLLLLVVTRLDSPEMMALAGISTLAGIFVIFYDLSIVGQLIPHYAAYNIVDLPKYYSYSPSLHEIMITLGGVAFAFSAFFFGETLFTRFRNR